MLKMALEEKTDPRPSWDQVFIDMLESLAKRSCCLKIHTSALIAKGSQILAIGYNGTFSKHKECDEVWREFHANLDDRPPFKEWVTTDEFRLAHREWSVGNEVHAEANALQWINKRDIEGCIMYTLYSPCNECAKSIISYGIKTIYYKHFYSKGLAALSTLNNAGVDCILLE